MSSVFSAEPPVFTRSTPGPSPAPEANSSSQTSSSSSSSPPPPAYQPPTSSSVYRPPTDDYIAATSTATATATAISTNRNAADLESERYLQEQMDLIRAQEESEKQQAIEAARKAEEERQKQIAAQQQWESKKTLEVKQQLNQKLHRHLTKLAEETKVAVQSDHRDHQRLLEAKQQIDNEIQHLETCQSKVAESIATVDAKTVEIQSWLQEANNESKEDAEVMVDDLVQPVTKLHAQMLELSAENAALTDALYFLDRAMYMGHMDCSTHLKSVRKLAKRQFLIRAHILKINQVIMGQTQKQ